MRIYCTQTSPGSDNYSLYDFQVFGTPLPDLAYGRPAYSSTVENPGYAPGMAVDGNSGTRWSSGQWMQSTSTGWIYVDLGATYNIDEVRLNWETAYAVNYQIQTSTDAQNWTTIDTITGNQSKGIVDFSGLSGVGQYVRILCTQTSQNSDNYSLYDFQVFGTPAAVTFLVPAGSLTPLSSGCAILDSAAGHRHVDRCIDGRHGPSPEWGPVRWAGIPGRHRSAREPGPSAPARRWPERPTRRSPDCKLIGL